MKVYRTKPGTHRYIDPWGLVEKVFVDNVLEEIEIEQTKEIHMYKEYYTNQMLPAVVWTDGTERFWAKPPTDFGGHTIYVSLDDPTRYFKQRIMVKSIKDGEPFLTEENRKYVAKKSKEEFDKMDQEIADAKATLEKYGVDYEK